jgi:hypothetical protein
LTIAHCDCFQVKRLMDLLPPNAVTENGRADAVGVMQGNYGGTATGKLSITLCNLDPCVTGTDNLSGSADNSVFWVQLKEPLAVSRIPTALRDTS